MIEYIKSLGAQLPRENSGYKYVCSDSIFIPIQKTRLAIIKRKVQDLRFVDEMILKFIHEGVTNIQELSGLMGLPRDILDISLADLYQNDYISITSKACQIQAKGARFINGEKSTKKERDEMRDVYVNLCTGNIFEDGEGLVNNYYSHAYKFAHSIVADIAFFKKEIGELKQIFNERKIGMPTASPAKSQRTEVSDEELFSIEKTIDSYVLFKRVKLNFYVSETNEIIDIVPTDTANVDIINSLKDTIISEIKQRRLLRPITSFTVQKIEQMTPLVLPYPAELKQSIKAFATTKARETIITRIEELIFTDRELLENELLPLIKLLSNISKKAEIYIGKNISYVFQNPEITNTMQLLSEIELLTIFYNNSDGFDKGSKTITSSTPKIKMSNFTKSTFQDELKIIFDDKYVILAVPAQISIYGNMSLNFNKYYFFNEQGRQ